MWKSLWAMDWIFVCTYHYGKMIINFKYYLNDLKYGSDIVLSLLYFADPLGQTTIDSRLRYDTYSPHHHLRGSEKQNGSPSGRSPNGETYKHLDSHRYELPFITICKVIIIILLFLFFNKCHKFRRCNSWNWELWKTKMGKDDTVIVLYKFDKVN